MYLHNIWPLIRFDGVPPTPMFLSENGPCKDGFFKENQSFPEISAPFPGQWLRGSGHANQTKETESQNIFSILRPFSAMFSRESTIRFAPAKAPIRKKNEKLPLKNTP